MRFLWHVFGHDGSSYGTLSKSAGVSDALSQRLERFTWGQTNSAEYLDSLESEPAFWVEHLDNVTAITRVLAGEPDSAGRATLKFVTLLSSVEDWSHEVAPALQDLLDQRVWDPGGATPLEVTLRRDFLWGSQKK